MRRTVQEEEEATAAFCSSASRCADGGRGPVWFHFKRSGRGTRPVKLMRQVQRGLACVCVCVRTVCVMVHRQYFNSHVMCMCLRERVGWTFCLFAADGFTATARGKMVCLYNICRGHRDLLATGYLTSPCLS